MTDKNEDDQIWEAAKKISETQMMGFGIEVDGAWQRFKGKSIVDMLNAWELFGPRIMELKSQLEDVKRQRDEAVEQLQKIGKKAFWAAKHRA